MAVSGGLRPLLYLTFCIYLSREILFLSEKGGEFCKEISVATMVHAIVLILLIVILCNLTGQDL